MSGWGPIVCLSNWLSGYDTGQPADGLHGPNSNPKPYHRARRLFWGTPHKAQDERMTKFREPLFGALQQGGPDMKQFHHKLCERTAKLDKIATHRGLTQSWLTRGWGTVSESASPGGKNGAGPRVQKFLPGPQELGMAAQSVIAGSKEPPCGWSGC